MTMGYLRQNWPTLLRPTHPVDGTDRIAQFVCEPLDCDFAHELALALRHALLHSVPGAAIVRMRARLDGTPAPDRWSSDLALALSQVAIADCDGDRQVTIEAAAGTTVRAWSLVDAGLSLIDGQPVLCVARGQLTLELWIERRAGMRLASQTTHRLPAGVVAVDAFFTPVLRADCFCTQPTVGAWADCSRLVIEVETNGTITPADALAAAVRVLTGDPGRRLDRAA